MIIPVNVEQIDVVGPKPLEGLVYGDTQVLLMVSDKVDADTGVLLCLSSFAVRGVFAEKSARHVERANKSNELRMCMKRRRR